MIAVLGIGLDSKRIKTALLLNYYTAEDQNEIFDHISLQNNRHVCQNQYVPVYVYTYTACPVNNG